MVNASTSPHIRSNASTATIMRDVAIALLPALLFGVFVFGLRALVTILLCAVTCVLTEWLYQKLMKLPVTVADGSALVTGLILAMNLPAAVPVYIPVLGSVFAIIIVKQVFGGVGQNVINPALGARCFLLLSYGKAMATFQPVGNLFGSDALDGFLQRMTTWNVMPVDAESAATPLTAMLGEDKTPVDLLQAFLGLHAGCIGEVSAVAILLGFVYLLARGVISWRIPTIYVGSTVVFVFLFNLMAGNGVTGWEGLLSHVLTGGLLAGAVFMATDYVTSPITVTGQVVYALLIGFFTALFRLFSGAEGVSYAILFTNCLVPLIERATMPRAFGKPRACKKKGGAA